jgi:hypothetical protein
MKWDCALFVVVASAPMLMVDAMAIDAEGETSASAVASGMLLLACDSTNDFKWKMNQNDSGPWKGGITD